jgi:hypothetical protein
MILATTAPRSGTSVSIAAVGMRKVVKRDAPASVIEPTSALLISTPSPGPHSTVRPRCEAVNAQVGAAMNDRSPSLINSFVWLKCTALLSANNTPRPGSWQTVACERKRSRLVGSMSRLHTVRPKTSRQAVNRSGLGNASVENWN